MSGRRDAERGFTLVELMTALSITVILTGAMLGLTQKAHDSAQRVTRDVGTLESWRDTLADLTGDLRRADLVTTGGGAVTLTGATGEVRWTLDDGRLTRSADGRTTRVEDDVAGLSVRQDGALRRIELAVRRPDNHRVMQFTAAVAARTEARR